MRNWGRVYSPEEETLLRDLAKTCTMKEIAERLGRSFQGVQAKLNRMHIRAVEADRWANRPRSEVPARIRKTARLQERKNERRSSQG